MYLKDMFNSEKRDILRLYSFDFVDSIYICIQPFLIGKAIDGLFDNSFLWLFVLIGAYLFNVLIGYFNNIDDDIVYNRIKLKYRNRYYHNAINRNIATSTIDANVELVDSVVDFIRCFVANYLEKGFMLFAALIFVFSNFGFQIQATVFFACLISVFIGIVANKKMIPNLNALYDVNEERRVKIGSRDSNVYTSFLNKRYSLIITNSKIDATGTLIINFIRIIALASSLFFCSKEPAASIGIIYAGIEYIIMLMDGFDAIPEIYYEFKDVSICVHKINSFK
ncbi:MAG: hypothetical protein IKZ35_02615 [Clostridia bacterium]|nr:hypothetical protein [Clostridia bacterium]